MSLYKPILLALVVEESDAIVNSYYRRQYNEFCDTKMFPVCKGCGLTELTYTNMRLRWFEQ